MIELVVALLAVGAGVYVILPLRRPEEREDAAVPAVLGDLLERKRLALTGILDMEEERDSGKLTDRDYDELRSRYEQEALEALRELEDAGRDRDAELEAEIARLKAALVCPDCGAILRAGSVCTRCGAS